MRRRLVDLSNSIANGQAGHHRAVRARIDFSPTSGQVHVDFLSLRESWSTFAWVDLSPEDAVRIGEALLELGQHELEAQGATELPVGIAGGD